MGTSLLLWISRWPIPDYCSAMSLQHANTELKSSLGDRFEKAVVEVVDETAETMEDTIEVYVAVQRGTKFGVFNTTRM